MRNPQHTIYFIGGPLDLTKTTAPGLRPKEASHFAYQMPVMPVVPRFDDPRREAAMLDEEVPCKVVEYQLHRIKEEGHHTIYFGLAKNV